MSDLFEQHFSNSHTDWTYNGLSGHFFTCNQIRKTTNMTTIYLIHCFALSVTQNDSSTAPLSCWLVMLLRFIVHFFSWLFRISMLYVMFFLGDSEVALLFLFWITPSALFMCKVSVIVCGIQVYHIYQDRKHYKNNWKRKKSLRVSKNNKSPTTIKRNWYAKKQREKE